MWPLICRPRGKCSLIYFLVQGLVHPERYCWSFVSRVDCTVSNGGCGHSFDQSQDLLMFSTWLRVFFCVSVFVPH